MLFKQKNLKASGVVFILSYVVFKSLRNWQFQIVEKIGRKKETYLRNTQTTNNYRALISWFIAWLSLNHDIIYLYGKPTLWHRKVHFEDKQTFHSLHYDNNVLAHNNSVIHTLLYHYEKEKSRITWQWSKIPGATSFVQSTSQSSLFIYTHLWCVHVPDTQF